MFTWLWNIRHRKIIEETKRIMRFRWFLRHELGLKEELSVKVLRQLLYALKTKKKD